MASQKLPSKSKPSRQSHRGEPQTMEALLAATGYQFKGLRRGQTVSGLITQISAKTVLLNIGAKTEGVVGEREFEAAGDFIKTLKVGDEISCQVVNPDSDSGQIFLSLKKTAFSSGWQKLHQAQEKGEEVEVLVTQAARSGLVAEIFGLSGFIPFTQIARVHQGKLNELVGKKIKVKVLEAEGAEEKLIFSEKAVSEKENLAQMLAAMEKVAVGQEYQGAVTGVTPFGVFVEIKVGEIPLEGLVHISEMAWEKIEEPSSLLKIGDEVKVKVIGLDKEASRLALSLKQLIADPWLSLVTKYPPETPVKGKVVRLLEYGAFVELEPELVGLLHISKIPAEHKIDVGDEISCVVESIEPEKRRLSLDLVLKEKPVGYK